MVLLGDYNVGTHTLTFDAGNQTSRFGLDAISYMRQGLEKLDSGTYTLSAGVGGNVYSHSFVVGSTVASQAWNMGTFVGEYGSQFRQIVNTDLLTIGDIVTVSAYVNNTKHSFTKTIQSFSGSIKEAPYDLETSWGGFKLVKLEHRTEIFFVMYLKPSQSITVNWAKLERGSSVTPYVPKGYGAELSECLRFYYQVDSVKTFGQQHTGAGTFVNIILPQIMRVTPTVSAPGEWTIRFNGMDKKATVSSINSLTGNTLNLTMSTIAGGTYIGPLYAFYNSEITFSADL